MKQQTSLQNMSQQRMHNERSAGAFRFTKHAGRIFVLAAGLLGLLGMAQSQAQTTYTWITETNSAGGTVDWSTAAKWGGTAPAPGTVNLDFSGLTAATSPLTLRNDIAGTFDVFKWTLAKANIATTYSKLGASQIINFVQVGGLNPEIIHDSFGNAFPAHQYITINTMGITGAGTVLQITGTALGSASLQISTAFTGEGGININKTGRAAFSGASTFTGDFTLTSGTVLLDVSTTGPVNNVATGPLGRGTVNLNGGTLVARTAQRTLGNSVRIGGNFQAGNADWFKNITLAGTTLLTGAGVTHTITGGFTGADAADNNTLTFDGAITDDGAGNGLAFTLGTSKTKVVLSGLNTYTGNTTVNGNASNSLTLSEPGGLVFVIGANGVNNSILGNGTVQLDGIFTFDLTGAGTGLGNSWNIVNVATLSETFGTTFNVADFTDNLDNTWSKTSGDITYTFFENSGLLQVTAVPEPSVIMLLALGLMAVMLRRRVA